MDNTAKGYKEMVKAVKDFLYDGSEEVGSDLTSERLATSEADAV